MRLRRKEETEKEERKIRENMKLSIFEFSSFRMSAHDFAHSF